MTPMQRFLAAINHTEPDRVPIFLLAGYAAARGLGLTVREYFSKAENVVEGQTRFVNRFGSDCLYAFAYASLELEAFGGETLFSDDGPPNAGAPVLAKAEDILSLGIPRIAEQPGLQRVLETERLLKEKARGQMPIMGVVVSPFSLPVMQLGFSACLDLMFEQPRLFSRLMQINEAFCVDWANAQLSAGATIICYFDPVASSTITTREQYLALGYPAARRVMAKIKGPVCTHLGSGRGMPVLKDLIRTGTMLAGVSSDEDLGEMKKITRGKMALMGNLNGVEMRTWSSETAEQKVREAIRAAGPGGGFILSDNHGEIPGLVSDEVLMAVTDAVRRWGRYPLTWAK